jgi:hypothetical protein
MNTSKAIGLGEPEIVGKKSLFQPPQKTSEQDAVTVKKSPTIVERRVRMTLEVSLKSLSIVQESQSQYRLRTGHSLPKWKIIDDALEMYGKSRKGEGSEK